jgi:serine/threonine protein kinase
MTMTDLTDLYRLGNYIDTFALGHYARVVAAIDERRGQQIAFKLMRTEHLTGDGDIRWEFRAFINEAELLLKLADSPHVVDMLDCGYLAGGDEVPTGGEIVSYGQDVAAFARDLVPYAGRNWRPYLTMPLLPRTDNLFYLMKPTQQASRWRLPTEEGLALAIQFAHVLQMAHQQSVVYLDHKLEHVYWDGVNLNIIDLNSSRQLDARLADQNYYQNDIHNLCVGILYPLFTGLSASGAALRPQPGSITQAESRYDDILRLDFGVEPTLSPALIDLLQRGAAKQLGSIDEFIAGLEAVAALHGWDFRSQETSAANRSARDHMRTGLRALREGQMSLREARDHFREAAILDGITEDLEDELRRLVKAVNDMLNQRVIP